VLDISRSCARRLKPRETEVSERTEKEIDIV
jgi:hypothetical protein